MFFWIILGIVIVVLFILGLFIINRFRDRHPYNLIITENDTLDNVYVSFT